MIQIFESLHKPLRLLKLFMFSDYLHVLLMLTIGAVFVPVTLFVGKLIRPHRPHSEKNTTYECGEEPQGSAWVQFNLRFYTLAILFIIFEVEIAFKHFQKEGIVFPPHEQIVKNFYNQLLELERQGKNGIWARFLKNAFAPMIAERFDYVIGNPP